jgi:hypothetical protein
MPEHATAGPLLSDLVSAHRAAERATAYPDLSTYATSLAALCEDMGSPLVWPVDGAAERLAGAAVLTSEGDLRLRGWTDEIRGERVLLTCVAAVSPLGLVEAARQARTLGAIEVHACGIEVAGFDSPDLRGVFDSREVLTRQLVAA